MEANTLRHVWGHYRVAAQLKGLSKYDRERLTDTYSASSRPRSQGMGTRIEVLLRAVFCFQLKESFDILSSSEVRSSTYSCSIEMVYKHFHVEVHDVE